MFFEDEKDNLENLDNLEEIDLDLGDDIDDDSIDWDELLKDDDEELVSVAADKAKPVAEKKPAPVPAQAVEEEPLFDDLTQEEPLAPEATTKEVAQDAFDIFGGSDEEDEEIIEEIPAKSPEFEGPKAYQQVQNEIDDDEYVRPVGISQNSPSKLPILLGVLVAIVCLAGGYFLMSAKKPAGIDFTSNPPAPVSGEAQAPQVEPDMPDVPAPQGVSKQQVKIPTEDSKNAQEAQIPVVNDEKAKTLKPEKKITVSVESTGRINPFLPTSIEFSKNIYAGIPSQTLLPPEAYGEDIGAQNLMKVSVSGILFDNVKPSAIITINGVDYFVQKGDIVDDFHVLDINRQAVVVKKGTNIYKAGVGEMLNRNFEIAGSSTMENGVRHYVTASDTDVEVKTKTKTKNKR